MSTLRQELDISKTFVFEKGEIIQAKYQGYWYDAEILAKLPHGKFLIAV